MNFGLFALAGSTSFWLVFLIFLVVMTVLVVFIVRWAIRENRARRERFNSAERSTDRG